MKTISRYIMTLALLLTAVGGAWAQGETLLTTITATGTDSYSEETPGVVTVTHDNSHFDGTYGWLWWSHAGSITVEAKEGYTITRCVFRQSSKTPVTVSTAPFKVDFIETANPRHPDQKKFLCQGDWKLNMNGVSSIEVYGYAPAPAADPDAIDVTTNAAEEGATFTEATFAMPPFDATAEYELVRDMSVQMTAQVGDGTQEQPRYRVKKDGNKFIPADMEMAAVPALFTVNDAIEQKALTQTQDYIVQIYAIDAEGQPTGEAMTFATFTFEPGIYAVKAVAADGSDYDGETDLSNTFQLFEGYDLTVKPANDFSKGKVESVTVGTGSVTIDANTGEATKTNVAPDTEVKVKAKRGYVIDKVEAKKAGPALKTLTVTAKQLNYVEGDTWQQAIERPENAGSGWKVQGNYIFNGGLTLFTNGGGATYVYVKPGDTIDATKNYSLEAD